MLKGRLVDGGAGQVVEGQRLVNVLDVDQDLEDAEVVLHWYALARLLRWESTMMTSDQLSYRVSI